MIIIQTRDLNICLFYICIYIYISKVHQDSHTFNSGRDKKASQHDHDHSHPGGTNHHLSHDHMNPSNNQLINIYNLNTDETTSCPPPQELLQVTEHIIKSYNPLTITLTTRIYIYIYIYRSRAFSQLLLLRRHSD